MPLVSDFMADLSRLILLVVSVYGAFFFAFRRQWMGVFHTIVAASMIVFSGAVPMPDEYLPYWAIAVNLATAAIATSALHASRRAEKLN